jgi:5-methylcytosine-specific restriction protein A
MPMMPPRRCSSCGRVVAGRCGCRPAWRGVHVPPPRIRGRRLQQLRADLFARQPVCVLCRVAPATIRDHIVNLAAGGTDTPDNEQAVCETCHDAKTADEATRGRTGEGNITRKSSTGNHSESEFRAGSWRPGLA